jgi:hypothetical protein
MNIDLAINGVSLHLGDRNDADLLAEIGFRRLNPLQRLIQREGWHQRRYHTIGCTVSCFGESFDLYPCTDGYLNRDRQWRTAAMLIYDRERLVGVSFRVIEGRYAASNYYDRFLELGEKHIGEPARRARGTRVWSRDGQHIVCMLDETALNADFCWMEAGNEVLTASAGS